MLQADNLADMVTATLKTQHARNKWTDLTTALRKFTWLPAMQREGRRMMIPDGYGYQFNVQVTTLGNAYRSGLYGQDVTKSGDTLKTATVPWRYNTTAWSMDVREPDMNRGESRILDIMLTRKHAAMMDLATLMETDGWTNPADSTDDSKPFGIPYWIVQGATNSSETSLTGTNPTGYTAGAGGLSSTTYPLWANYSMTYVDPTFADLVDKLRQCVTLCDFETPVENTPNYDTGEGFEIFTSYSNVLKPLETLLTKQNMNLGNDLGSKDGMVTIHGIPMKWKSFLTTDGTLGATNPVYGINWSTMKVLFMQGWFMKTSPTLVQPGSHNVVNTFLDNMYNFVCTDRRKNFVLHI